MQKLSEIAASRELFINLTLRELRSKYKRSVLGWAWSMLNPLATMVIFSLVFRFFLKAPVEEGDPSGLKVFALFLLGGLLPFNFLSNGLMNGLGSLVANANLVKKVYFPREILVAAVVTSWGVSFLIELGLLVTAVLIFGNMVIPYLPVVILVVLIQWVFVLGLALTASVCSVYFRDLEYLSTIGLQVWFYLTPIIYPMVLVEDAFANRPKLLHLYELNPLTRFVEVYRDLLYHVRLPALWDLGFLVAVAVVSIVTGLVVFGRLEPRLAEEL
jgi:ABC-type polysaccharide/polyol phosphate export permease